MNMYEPQFFMKMQNCTVSQNETYSMCIVVHCHTVHVVAHWSLSLELGFLSFTFEEELWSPCSHSELAPLFTSVNTICLGWRREGGEERGRGEERGGRREGGEERGGRREEGGERREEGGGRRERGACQIHVH